MDERQSVEVEAFPRAVCVEAIAGGRRTEAMSCDLI